MPICFYFQTKKVSTSSTTNTHIHEASGAGHKIVCDDNRVENFEYRDFFGENCIQNFVKSLVEDCKLVAEKYLIVDIPMEKMTKEEVD
jgi:hypothetical protein